MLADLESLSVSALNGSLCFWRKEWPLERTPFTRLIRGERQREVFSLGTRKLYAVVVGGIRVHRVHVHGWISAAALRRELDDELRPLNAVVGAAVFPGLMGGRSTPGKPGIVQIGLDLCQRGVA